MISGFIRKLKILLFLFSKKVYDDTKFFDDRAICKGCNELEDVYRYEEGTRVWIFYFIPVRFPWRLEMCTYCYTVRRQEFTWGKDEIKLDYSFGLIKKSLKKSISNPKEWKGLIKKVWWRILPIFSQKRFKEERKCDFVKCAKCENFDDIYREFGNLFFLGFISMRIWCERKVCKNCGNIQDEKINIPKDNEEEDI